MPVTPKAVSSNELRLLALIAYRAGEISIERCCELAKCSRDAVHDEMRKRCGKYAPYDEAIRERDEIQRRWDNRLVEPKEEVYCRNNGDNESAKDLMRRLRALRSDSDYHGELLAMLCLDRNRETIRKGGKELDHLFEMIDTYSQGHVARLACLDKKESKP